MLLEWLCDKISDSIHNERIRRYDEEQAQKRKIAYPIMNDLCQAELHRFAKNPAIATIYALLFHEKPPVKRVTVYCTGVEAFYSNDTSYFVDFRTLGLVELSYENRTIFMNNPILHDPSWYYCNSEFKSAIDKYPYLYFCTSPNCFNECRAVGYLLAEKSGLPYEKTDSPINAVEFVFPTNENKLKSW